PRRRPRGVDRPAVRRGVCPAPRSCLSGQRSAQRTFRNPLNAMAKTLSMLTTIKGSLLENFYPKGWDLKKIDACCEMNLKQFTAPKKSWSRDFKPVPVDSVA